MRYTAYQQFNGSSTDYNGFGRNAKDNNIVSFLVWWFDEIQREAPQRLP